MRSLVLAGVALGMIAACSGQPASQTIYGSDGPPRISIASIELRPNPASVTVSKTTRLIAIPKDRNGNALSGRAVVWSSSNNTIASVTDSGLVAGLHAGQTGITATSEGVSAAATVTVSDPAPAPVASVSVALNSSSLLVGQGTQAIATEKDANGNTLTGRTVTFASNNPSVATVSSTGYVNAVAAGTAVITATSEGVSGSGTVTVTAPPPAPVASLTVTLASSSLTVGQSTAAIVVLKDASGNTLSGRTITYSSGNTSIATVSSTGSVTAVGAGSAVITATSEGVSGSATLTATSTPSPVASVTVTLSSSSLTIGQTTQAVVTLRDASGNTLSGRPITYTSNNATIASVSSAGMVTAVAAGSAVITATSEGVSGTATLTVTAPPPNPVAAVTVTLNSSSLTIGQSTQAVVTLKDAGGNTLSGRTITYSSGNTGVATVSTTGMVTAVAAGSAVITATSEGVSGTATLTVTLPPVASVTVTLNSSSLTVGQTTQAVVTLKDASGNTLTGRAITYASNSSSVATVSSTGVVTAAGAGSALITATSEGVSGSTTLTVTLAPVATVTVTLTPSTVTVNQTAQAVVTLRDASGNALTGRTIAYTSSNTNVATVSSTGMVSALAAGTAQITATSEGKSGSATLTVQAAPPPPPPGFPNEPAGFTRVLEHSFDQMPGTSGTGTDYIISGGAWNNWTYANTTITDDATAPFSPSRVIKVTWPTGLDDGERQGTGIDGRFGADYREVYISIRFKILGTTFENQDVGTKLLGYVNYGGYERDNQFYWLLKERDWNSGDGPGGIRSGPFFLESRVSYPYTQVYGTTAVRGVQYLANNQGTGNTVLPGQWVHMEAYFKLNTKNADGSYNRDGVVKQWINGVLVQSYNNVDWLTPSTTSLGDHGFYGWHFDPIWGGNSGQIKTRDDNMYIDHVYISGIKQ